MPEIRNDVQTVSLGEIGGTVSRWQYRGVDVFFPQQEVRRGGVRKVRGGMHACWPCFGTPDAKFGLPQHGVLRDRKADVETEDGFVFRGTDLLGPAHDEESEVRIAVTLAHTGFTYALSARLLEPAESPVFVNAGLHPYFRTPTGNAEGGAWIGKEIRFSRRLYGPTFEDIGKGAQLIIPGIGEVKMLLGGALGTAPARKLVFWRDSRDYLCAEPVFGDSKSYGSPSCLRLTEQWLEVRCSFQIRLD